eukprot:5454593-Amphidinium_carterae.1
MKHVVSCSVGWNCRAPTWSRKGDAFALRLGYHRVSLRVSDHHYVGNAASRFEELSIQEVA